MGAPTNPANVKKVLANSEPSTHGGRAEVIADFKRTAPIRYRCDRQLTNPSRRYCSIREGRRPGLPT